MFSDPFRLVWQLMQPIFELVSFYLVSFINQYVNFFSFDTFPEKIENLHLSCASYVVNKICILQICWAFVFEIFTLYQNLSSNWLWITQNWSYFLISFFQFVFDIKTAPNITITCLRTFTSALIKVSSGFYRSGQWGPCLEPPLRMASSATTFAKPGLNYLHGTPQSLDQAVLAVIVLLQHREIEEKRQKKGTKLNTRIERNRGQMGNFILCWWH